jgi:hypothetical protein
MNTVVFRNKRFTRGLLTEASTYRRDAIPRVTFMSRYFFDLHNGGGPTRDEEGVELNSRDDIARVIRRILLDVATDELTELQRGMISVTVRDHTGQPVCVSSLSFNYEWLK